MQNKTSVTTPEQLHGVEKQLTTIFSNAGFDCKFKHENTPVPISGTIYTALLCHVGDVDNATKLIAEKLKVVFYQELRHVAYGIIDDVMVIIHDHDEKHTATATAEIKLTYESICYMYLSTHHNATVDFDVQFVRDELIKHGIYFSYRPVIYIDDQGHDCKARFFTVTNLHGLQDLLDQFTYLNISGGPSGMYIQMPSGNIIFLVDHDNTPEDNVRFFNEVHAKLNKKDDIDKDDCVDKPVINVARFNVGLVSSQETSSDNMYQHYVVVPHHKTSDVASDLIAQILKHKNMHSLPMYGSLCKDFQDDLSLHGVTPIKVINGEVCWVREILATGVTFSDVFESFVDDGVDVKYHLYVMHLHIGDRNLAVCVSKRYTGKKTTPSYLLNVVELLDEERKPFDGDVIKHIYQYLATA